MDTDDDTRAIRIEVAFAAPDTQALIELRVREGTTVEQAIEQAGLYQRFPHRDLGRCAVGVWGRLVHREHRVQEGDRVELYRPLLMDPREARRLRAKG